MVAKFQGLPHFRRKDLATQDVIGKGSFGAVFKTKYSPNESGSVEVLMKKLLSSSVDFIDALIKEAKLLSQLDHEISSSSKLFARSPWQICWSMYILILKFSAAKEN